MTEVTKATARAELITGLVGTGKTELLVHSLKSLLDSGTSADDIRVFCATTDAAMAFQYRLESLLAKSSPVKVTTPRDLALDILSTEDAIAFTGRKPILLSDFETNFLLEDMKVSGMRPKRLREMLKFFYRSWTELADDDETWLITGEEQQTHALLKSTLDFDQAMLLPELSNLAVNYLRQNTEVLKNHTIPHVFVDDYQCLNRASQILLNMIAGDHIAIAGHEAESIEVGDPHPYAAGIDEFKQINPHAQETQLEASWLSEPVTLATNRLLADASMNMNTPPAPSEKAPQGSFEICEYAFFQDEFEGTAAMVKNMLSDGTVASDIFVIVPNKIWRTHISNALISQNIEPDALPDRQILGGDIRDYKKCAALRVFTALKLVADPSDALAWRSWCGFGDYLTNSGTFNKMKEYTKEHGKTMVEALEELDTEPSTIPGAEKVVGAYRAGKRLLEKVADLKGEQLLEGLTTIISVENQTEILQTLTELCEPGLYGPSGEPVDLAAFVEHKRESKADAKTLVAHAMKTLIVPHFSHSQNAVKIGSPHHLCGLSPKTIIYTGFVNGFIPVRDYFDGTVTPPDKMGKMHAEDTKKLYTTLGKAHESLVMSYFTKSDLESAERLKLEIARIKLEEGKRICTISPSEFLETIA